MESPFSHLQIATEYNPSPYTLELLSEASSHGCICSEDPGLLGHESLEVTLDYLGVEDATDQHSQEQVNSGALSAFV